MSTKYRFIPFVAMLITVLIIAGSSPIASAQGTETPPSVFYKFDIVAKTGDSVKSEAFDPAKNAQPIRHISPGVSINDQGEVVFVANNGSNIVRHQPLGELQGITPILSFASVHELAPFVTSNNQSLVLAYDKKEGMESGDEFQITNHIWRLDPILDRVVAGEKHNLTKEVIGSGKNVVLVDSVISVTNGISKTLALKLKVSQYESVRPCTSINNQGQIAFLARRYPDDFLVTAYEYKFPGSSPPAHEFRFQETKINVDHPEAKCPSITDDGRTLIWTKIEYSSSQSILLFNFELTQAEIVATTTGLNPWWSKLGSNQGISHDGKVIVFYGDLTLAGATALQTIPGPGIFASIDEGIKDKRKIVRVAGWPTGDAEYIEAPGGNDDGFCDSGEECLEDVKAAQTAGTWDGNLRCDPGETCAQFAELGFDTTGKPLGSFNSSDSFIQNNRIAVLHQISGKTGINGDSFTLAFMATPRQELTAAPKALWTVRVDIKQIEDKGQPEQSRLIYQPVRPQRVVQIGDELGGYTIQDIVIHEPLANAENGNHQLAFWAQTNKGEMVVRATYLDNLEKRIVVTTGSAIVDGDTSSVRALLANPGVDGKISLSEALSAVNQTGPGYTINFSLPSGEKKVFTQESNPLLLSVSNTTIDGDRDRDGKPDIEIHHRDDNMLFYEVDSPTLLVSSANNLIRGISLQSIVFEGREAYNNTLFNCYIGLQSVLERFDSLTPEFGGVEIRNSAHHNRVLGNLVTSNPTYASTRVGIKIYAGAHDNLIGEAGQPGMQSICSSTCNVIKNNPRGGVVVLGDNTVGNSIRGNLIFDNGDRSLADPPKAIGIDLGGDGITLNDVPARMQGPNTWLNAPMSLAADFDGANTVISGVYKATPVDPTSIIIDIYGKNKPGDLGEANAYLGFTTPKPDGTFELIIPNRQLPTDYYVSATATDNKGNTSEFSLQTPMIFVPGVSASTLVENDEEIWLGLNTLLLTDIPQLGAARLINAVISMNSFRQHLNLMNPTKGSVVATDAIRYLGPNSLGPIYPTKLLTLLTVYGDFLNDLVKNGGYREYYVSNNPKRRTAQGCDYDHQSANAPTLFIFAYDWRLSNKDNAEKLRDYIGCVQKFYPGARVNLVGHSMGGILARRYILDNPDHHVGRMISIATPWIGAGKVAYALATGDFIPVIASGPSIKDAMWSMTSTHELFLSPTWIEKLHQKTPVYGPIKTKNGKYDYADFADYGAFMSELPIITGCEKSSLNECAFPPLAGKEFHEYSTSQGDQEFMKPDTSGVKYFHLYSLLAKDQTIERVRAEFAPPRCTFYLFGKDCGKPRIIFVKEFGIGDETVPLLSLSPWAIPSDIPNSYETRDHRIVCEFRSPSESDDKYYTHSYIPNNELVRNKVLELLVGSSPVPEVCNPHLDRQLGQRQPQFINIAWQPSTPNVVQAGSEGQHASSLLEVNGAWGQIISDSAGNRTAIISNTMLLDDIPDISRQSSGDQYTQWILGSAETYTVTLLTRDEPFSIALATNDGVTVTQAVRYQDIVLPQGITATLFITPANLPTLRYDGNGDGILETLITPTLVIMGPLAADLAPPEIAMRVTDVQTPTMTIHLSAQDSGSGVKALWYSLDGTHYQLYKEPFQAHAEQTLYTFADDNVTNRGAMVQTLDITPPVVHINAPISHAPVNQGDPLTVTLTVTDNGFVRSVNVAFAANGEGVVTTLPATLISTDTFQALFPPTSGRTGLRTIHVEAVDPSGNKGIAETIVDVHGDDLIPTPPPTHLRFETPAEGVSLPLGRMLQVHLASSVTPDIRWVIVTFDVNDNGIIDGAEEAKTASASGSGGYTVTFAGASGAPGTRYVHAFAINDSGTVETASRKVTVAEMIDEPTFTPTATSCPPDSVATAGGCATITPSPTATPTPTFTATPTSTATSSPTSTSTSSPTATDTPTGTATPSPTSTATATATRTATATLKPTRTHTPTPTLSPTPTSSVVHWIANGGGSWQDPRNWEGGAIPGPNSVVMIDNPDAAVIFTYGSASVKSLTCKGGLIISGGTLDIADASVINGPLTLANGTLTGSGELAVNGEVTWSGGIMSGTGKTIAISKLTINSSAEKRLVGRTLDNLREARWFSTPNTGRIVLDNGAVLNNHANAIFDMQFDGYLVGGGRFNNEGTLLKSAGADVATIATIFNNDGVVEVQMGTLNVQGGGTSHGKFSAAANTTLSFRLHTFEAGAQVNAATVRFEGSTAIEFKAGATYNVTDRTDFVSGAINFNPGSLVENVGNSVTITSAVVNFSSNRAITTQNLGLVYGELKGTDDVIVTDYLAWHGGQMSGSGHTVIQGEAELVGGNMTLNGRILDNRGTVTWSSPNGTVRLFMGGGAILNNDGYFFVKHNSPGIGLLHVYDGKETFNNNGTFFLLDSSGVVEIRAIFNNSGEVKVQSGTLRLAGGGVGTGNFAATEEATLAFANYTLDKPSIVKATNVNFVGGNVEINGTYDVTGTTATMDNLGSVTFNPGAKIVNIGQEVDLIAGKAIFNTSLPITMTQLLLSGSELAGNSDIAVTDVFTWSGGTMSGGGKTVVLNQLMITNSNSSHTLRRRILENHHTALWAGGDIALEDGAVLRNRLNATFEVRQLSSAGSLKVGTYSSGVLDNAGKIIKTGEAGVLWLIGTFTNTGTVEMQSGTLRLYSKGVNSGALIGAPGTAVEFSSNFIFTDQSLIRFANVHFAGGNIEVNGTYDVTDTTDTIGGGGPTVTFNLGAKILNMGQKVELTVGKIIFNTGLPITMTQLLLSGSELAGNSDIAVTDVFTWSGGTMSGGGKTVVLNQLMITNSNSSHTLRRRILENHHTALWAGGDIALEDGAVLRNRLNATLEVRQPSAPGVLTVRTYSSGVLDNAGKIIKTGGAGVLWLIGTFTNTGTVEMQSGTLRLYSTGVNSGALIGAPGTAVEFSSNFIFTDQSLIRFANVHFAGGNIEVNGTYDVTDTTDTIGGGGPTVTFNLGAKILNMGQKVKLTVGKIIFNTGLPITMTDLLLSGGELAGNSDIVVNGKFTWLGGYIRGSGKITINGGLEINGTGELSGRSLENNSKSAVWTAGTINAYNGAVFRNSSEGILTIVGTAHFTWCKPGYNYSCSTPGPQPSFINEGLLVKSGSGMMVLGSYSDLGSPTTFTNSGTVEVKEGSMSFAGGYNQSSGALRLSGGNIIASDTPINILGGVLSGTGTIIGNVVNAGVLSPGSPTGVLTITGSYNQTATGTLLIELANPNEGIPYDQLVVTEQATLNGSLAVETINGFTPEADATFRVLRYGSHSGAFAIIKGDGRSYTPNYATSNLTLR